MQKLLALFLAKILAYNYAIFNEQRFNNMLTNHIVSFEQLGPGVFADCIVDLVMRQ